MTETLNRVADSVDGRRPSSARAALNGRDDQDCTRVTGTVTGSPDGSMTQPVQVIADRPGNAADEIHEFSFAERTGGCS